MCAVLGFLFYNLIFPAINYMTLAGLKDSMELRNNLRDIPEDSSIQDIVSDDMLITAWDFNNRSPRFFTKLSNKKYSEPDFNHDMSLKDMTWASASTVYYFRPAVIPNPNSTDATYMSGDNVALSPAMFAFSYANEIKNVSMEDIKVISVGATTELADHVGKEMSLL